MEDTSPVVGAGPPNEGPPKENTGGCDEAPVSAELAGAAAAVVVAPNVKPVKPLAAVVPVEDAKPPNTKLPKANPVLEPALALPPKAGAGAAPNAPAPDAVPVDPGDNAKGAADGKLTRGQHLELHTVYKHVQPPYELILKTITITLFF